MYSFLYYLFGLIKVVLLVVIIISINRNNKENLIIPIGGFIIIWLLSVSFDNKPYVKAASFPIVTGDKFIDDEHGIIFNNNTVFIYTTSPSMGIIGRNQVSYGCDLNDLSKNIYEGFKGVSGLFKYGDYNVVVYTLNTDKYGNKQYSYRCQLCKINADEVKKYEDHYYFNKQFKLGQLMNKEFFGNLNLLEF